MRELWHHRKKFYRSRAGDLSDPSNFDNSASYDKWSVAYRLIGAYIDCDATSSNGNNNKKQNQNNNNNGNSSCSRWVIWAAYYNTLYKGGGYNEYFGSGTSSSSLLDCHSSTNRNWQLVGVYREELYQFYEQVSKHLWSSDDYEYIVATAGLAYMTDSSCSQVGNQNGRTIYAGVQPMPYANITMGLYTDSACTQLLYSEKKKHFKWGKRWNVQLSYSDFYYGSNNGGSQSTWWTNAQEPTMTLFNQVFSKYKSCTPCIDYPTYQDGSLLGYYGTDDSVMINQCWKFYSHYSYTCNGDCLSMASAQGTILRIMYRGQVFGFGTPSGDKESALSYFSYSLSSHQYSIRNHGIALLKIFISFVAFYLIGKYLLFRLKKRKRDRLLSDGGSERYVNRDKTST